MDISLCKTKLPMLIILGIILITPSKSISAHQQLFGQLTVEGKDKTVMMNGESITTEVTILSGIEIVTSSDSSANISFGKIGQITIAPNSKMNLDFSDAKITGILTKGQIKVAVAPNTKINIQTPNGIVTNPDQSQNSMIVINIAKGRTDVKTALGTASLNGVFLVQGHTSSGEIPVVANQKKTVGVFSDILTFFIKETYVDELLGMEIQTETLETDISSSVEQIDVASFK